MDENGNNTAAACSTENNFVCDKCENSFARKDSLKRHYATIHKETFNDDNVTKTQCIHPGCNEKFFHKSKMVEHMQKVHNTNITIENFSFTSMGEFLSWKENEECLKHLYFSKQTGSSSTQSTELSYYICQRDGTGKAHRKINETPRLSSRTNKKGRVKCNQTCPARMVVRKELAGDNVTVKYIKAHNHPILASDIKHHPVPLTEMQNIKAKLAIGVPPEKITKDLREGNDLRDSRDNDAPIKKKHYLEKRTVKEIARKMNVQQRLHADDATSVFHIVNKLCHEKYSPILLYKPQNEPVVVGPSDIPANDLFMLAFMTKEQAEMLKKHSSKILCVDGTHGTNQYAFNLITVLVPDEFGKGYPVAHLISNRQDESVMKFFFEAIKNVVGDISINALMTDDDNTGWNAVKSVFGSLIRHLLCRWHIHRAWGSKLRQCFPSDIHLQHEINQALIVMMEEKNTNTFKLLCEGFLSKYARYAEFISYIQTYYFKRNEKWAMCHRNFPHAQTDTNMFLESYHNRLKTFYMKRKTNKRIDDLLNLLLSIEEDDYWRHKKDSLFCDENISNNSNDHRHRHGMSIHNVDAHQESEVTWKVLSQNKTTYYNITKNIDICDQDHCFSRCLEISCVGLCGHMYTCSCEDSSDLCKHIHKVHSMVIINENHVCHANKKPDCVLFEPETPIECNTTSQANSSSATLTDVKSQLETINELISSESVQTLLLPHIKGVLNQVILQCKAVTSHIPETMDATEIITPSQKLSKMKRTRKKSKKVKQDVYPDKLKKKKISEELCAVNVTVGKGSEQDEENTMPPRDEKAPIIQPNSLQIVHPMLLSAPLTDRLYSNGCHNITMIDLLSLETELTSHDVSVIQSKSAQFHKGWLTDEVINSYLYNLTNNSRTMLYCGSSCAYLISEGKDFQKLWEKEDLPSVTLVFVPINLSGSHWVLLLLNIENREIIILDPLGQAQPNTTLFNKGILIADRLFSYKFNCKLKMCKFANYVKQTDSYNCGVFVCYYAKQLASGYSLENSFDTFQFRKEIYNTITQTSIE